MSIYEEEKQYHEKNLLERVIDDVLKNKGGELTQSDLNRVSVAAQIQIGIDTYRLQASEMSEEQLRNEKHNSTRLARHLEEIGKPRPPRCHAHAIISGNHKYAAQLRIIMAALKIRIDDPDNVCWLPENTAATPHPAFPAAIPHSRIHRFNYFFWLFSRLRGIRSSQIFRKNLQLIAKYLQEGNIPEYVMLKKGAGLPSGARFPQ
ncbi:A nuclease family of the HNH/ENDO VII superfamily with conserved AHH [Microbulbifer thermotolerans]|uniref:AHH domain-containing protein n=1 Tax=Microbulbifer thermotolerans TaxID=252514 RepID=UPI0008F04EB6|nr:AHH domain-containing protein [Microbulbifer thermotolerans]SFD10079.1 A nuclease family of the HNH/ENDO VII superfamily with conserved AHH [Microbulbifer thermotolerans]